MGPEGKTTAIQTLSGLLREKDSGVRVTAARVLGKMGPEAKAAIPALTELMKERDSGVRETVAAEY
jgi:HEAT repeat protein